MTRRRVLATLLFLTVVPLAGCGLNSDYSITVGEATNGSVIENTTAEYVDSWSGVRYEIKYNSAYKNRSNHTILTYERVNGSLERTNIARFTQLDPNPPVYQGQIEPAWEEGETTVFEVHVVNETTDTVIDSIPITVENNG